VDDKFYGRALRWWREKVGIKQAHLARTARIPPNTLSALENKGQGMKDDLFIQLCWLIGADPQVVADHAYFKFRRHLGERAKLLAADLSENGDDGDGAVPSLQEVMRLHDAASAAWRSYRLAMMRFMRPDVAVSAFLEDLFQDLEPEPPEGDPEPRRRKPRRPLRNS
jgi:transcriptional regulator with XRE-family HTH domain